MYAYVSELPLVVSNSLNRMGYKKKDIEISTSSIVPIRSSGGHGQQAYTVVVSLSQNKVLSVNVGSWGGANMFNPNNKVDLGNETVSINNDTIVIKGSSGNYNYAKLYVSNDFIDKYAAQAESISNDERKILDAYYSLKSGPYRTEAIKKVHSYVTIIDNLVNRDLLKKFRNGAVRITTLGKGAIR